MGGERRFQDGRIEVHLDHRAAPLLVHTWVGAPTMRVVEPYFAAVAELAEAGERYLIITDASRAGRPDASVRRAITQHSAALAAQREALSVGSVVIVSNALVRGALTAMSWVDSSMAEVDYVKDLPEALAKSRAVLMTRGMAWPPAADALCPQDRRF